MANTRVSKNINKAISTFFGILKKQLTFKN